jgi:hypothetical protein
MDIKIADLVSLFEESLHNLPDTKMVMVFVMSTVWRMLFLVN